MNKYKNGSVGRGRGKCKHGKSFSKGLKYLGARTIGEAASLASSCLRKWLSSAFLLIIEAKSEIALRASKSLLLPVVGSEIEMFTLLSTYPKLPLTESYFRKNSNRHGSWDKEKSQSEYDTALLQHNSTLTNTPNHGIIVLFTGIADWEPGVGRILPIKLKQEMNECPLHFG